MTLTPRSLRTRIFKAFHEHLQRRFHPAHPLPGISLAHFARLLSLNVVALLCCQRRPSCFPWNMVEIPHRLLTLALLLLLVMSSLVSLLCLEMQAFLGQTIIVQ